MQVIHQILLPVIMLFIIKKAFAFCPYECDCRDEPTHCPAGVSLVTDGCNCCKVCAKQVGQQCNDDMELCDPHRSLFCDFSRSRSGDWGVCAAQSGRPCQHEGMRLASGSMFEPSCKKRCWCMDGAIGCVPLCPHETQIPRPDRCPNARLETVPGECCDQWVCGSAAGAEILPLEEFWSDYVGESETNSSDALLPSTADDNVESLLTNHGVNDAIYESDGGTDGDELFDYQQIYIDSPTNRGEISYDESWVNSNLVPGEGTGGRWRSECQTQTSAWSQCSKTCGLGISTRVTNANSECRLTRETRLCMIRPCSSEKPSPKWGRRCSRQKRAQSKTHISYSGCRSVRSFRPRYCGVCLDANRCCSPRATRTSRIRFRCPNGSFLYKNLMVIKSCRCHRHCSDVMTVNHRQETSRSRNLMRALADS